MRRNKISPFRVNVLQGQFQRVRILKRPLIIIVTAVMAMFAAPSQLLAQDARVNLTLEQRHVIKELIKDFKIEPSNLPAQPAVGNELPQDANPQPMPADIGRKVPQIKTHRVLLTADAIVIVEPKDNRVAEVIELKAN